MVTSIQEVTKTRLICSWNCKEGSELPDERRYVIFNEYIRHIRLNKTIWHLLRHHVTVLEGTSWFHVRGEGWVDSPHNRQLSSKYRELSLTGVGVPYWWGFQHGFKKEGSLGGLLEVVSLMVESQVRSVTVKFFDLFSSFTCIPFNLFCSEYE